MVCLLELLYVFVCIQLLHENNQMVKQSLIETTAEEFKDKYSPRKIKTSAKYVTSKFNH